MVGLFVALCLSANAANKMDEYSTTFIKERLCPLPKTIELFDEYYTLAKDSKVCISTKNSLEKSEQEKISALFDFMFKIRPQFVFGKSKKCQDLHDEAYSIKIDQNGIKICANNIKGVIHSLKTLRQMSEIDRFDAKKLVFAYCDIKDAPEISVRMLHLCLFPGITIERFEKYLRMAWYYKFNYVIIENWGTFPLESHKEFAFDNKISKKDFKRLIAVCKELSITPIPQMQLWGHAALATESSGKHAVLTQHPELANLYEPLGWTYCFSNPKTKQYLKDIFAELIDEFGNPPFIHFGGDEAYDRATCYLCRKKNHSQLFASVVNEFSQFVKEKGARAIIWHDTLLDANDPRWAKQIVHGDAVAQNGLKNFSKDIIIADWQYAKQTQFPTSLFFKENGFDVLAAPWNNKVGVYAFARCVRNNKLFGFLPTTWDAQFRRLDVVFFHSAQAAWSGGNEEVEKLYTTSENGPDHAHHRRLLLSIDKHFKDVEVDLDRRLEFKELGKHYNNLQIN